MKSADKIKILIVDDEEVIKYHVCPFLEEKDIEAVYEKSPLKALELVKYNSFDIVITDIKMPEMNGLDLLRQIKDDSYETEVIILTNFRTVDNAIEALKNGAVDFLSKPVNNNELYISIQKALKYRDLKKLKNSYQDRLANLQNETMRYYSNFQLIGTSRHIIEIKSLIDKITVTPDVTVLITGESGTGKDLAARLIHNQCRRSANPFIAVNCSAFTHSLIESELFGYEKGAFTGAFAQKKGLIEQADTGTLFLDEIGDMSIELQGNLLRVLENKEIRKIGGHKSSKIDVRFIAATNKDIASLIKQNKFRQDLYYRLNIVQLNLIPLRERKEDIPVLIEYFLEMISVQLRKNITGIDGKARESLYDYYFPGNIRELKSMIEQAVILADSPLLILDNFPALTYQKFKENEKYTIPGTSEKFDLKTIELEKIKEAIDLSNGNLVEAAKVLNIGYSALRYKINKYNILLFSSSFKKNNQ